MHLVLSVALWGCAPADSDHDGILDVYEAGFGTTVGDPDTDDDGLLDGEELDHDTHPLVADIDADGLTDGREVLELGTDPWLGDTDGDGYGDGDEVALDTDPLDPDDGVYAGGWPYQRDKDAFGGPALADAANETGERFARLKLLDQHGEIVDLYDFAGHDHPVIVSVDTAWCYPDTGLGAWIAGAEDADAYWSQYAHVRELVDAGDVYWVHILFQDANGGTVEQGDAAAWDHDHPHPLIPTLAGDEEIARVYVENGWPAVFFLDEEMRVLARPDGTAGEGHWDALAAANAYNP